MKRFVLTAAAALTISASGTAFAQLAPADIIAMRQSGMALTGGVTEAMKNGIAAGVDVKTFEGAATAMAKYGAVYVKLFPAGTETGGNTKAKKEIWSDRAGFEKAAADFVAASTKLVDAAKSGDKAAFAAAFQAEGQACGGCHRPYRER